MCEMVKGKGVYSRGVGTGGISVFIPPKSAQVNFYGVKMTPERLFNSFIGYPQKTYTPKQISGYAPGV